MVTSPTPSQGESRPSAHPRPTPPLGWGILGTGNIASVFARDLPLAEDSTLVAVGSRSSEGANEFAQRHRIPNAHGSYADLVADPGVQVVYVASPAHLHAEHVQLALNAGKHVLCEKPFTLNAKEARGVVALARENHLFLMEAMWTRFLPAMTRLGKIIASGEIGAVRSVRADLGIPVPYDDQARVYSVTMGGGSWMDMGIYGASLAHRLFGTPTAIQAQAHLTPSGVDGHAAVLLQHDGGAHALLTSSLEYASRGEATIIGTQGQIRIPSPWWCPTQLEVTRIPSAPALRAKAGRRLATGLCAWAQRSLPTGSSLARMSAGLGGSLSRWVGRRGPRPETVRAPFAGIGLHLEATEVTRCILAGLLESKTMPLDESIAILETSDRVRSEIGLRFPSES